MRGVARAKPPTEIKFIILKGVFKSELPEN